VVVADHELDPRQTPLFELQHEIAPACAALPIGKLHAQNASPAIPVDPHRNQHRAAGYYPIVPDLLIPRVQDQVRIRLLQGALCELPQLFVQALGQVADRRRAQRMAA